MLNALDLKSLLHTELTRRMRLNPRYSLRAFAKHLGVSPAYISMMMNGSRKPAHGAFERIVLKLGISNPSDFSVLDEKQFEMISDWYHFAILELITLPKFIPTPALIAKALAITPTEAKLAIGRLLDLGFMKKTKSGRYEPLSGSNTNISNNRAMQARKNMQRQLLVLAQRALDEVDFAQRDHSSMTMAIDSNQIPEAKERIKKFRRELCHFLQISPLKNSVYSVQIALYPHFNPNPVQKKEPPK